MDGRLFLSTMQCQKVGFRQLMQSRNPYWSQISSTVMATLKESRPSCINTFCNGGNVDRFLHDSSISHGDSLYERDVRVLCLSNYLAHQPLGFSVNGSLPLVG